MVRRWPVGSGESSIPRVSFFSFFLLFLGGLLRLRQRQGRAGLCACSYNN